MQSAKAAEQLAPALLLQLLNNFLIRCYPKNKPPLIWRLVLKNMEVSGYNYYHSPGGGWYWPSIICVYGTGYALGGALSQIIGYIAIGGAVFFGLALVVATAGLIIMGIAMFLFSVLGVFHILMSIATTTRYVYTVGYTEPIQLFGTPRPGLGWLVSWGAILIPVPIAIAISVLFCVGFAALVGKIMNSSTKYEKLAIFSVALMYLGVTASLLAGAIWIGATSVFLQ